MKELLNKIALITNEEKILKREKAKRGEDFNIFEVMRAQTEEVYTHSALIASLLDPSGNHGCETSFLKMFLNRIWKDSPSSLEIIGEKTNLFDFNISVEHYIGEISDNKENGGRLDILIENEQEKKAIIIENKIYAEDQSKQLYRYKQYANEKYKEGNCIILYLTLDGHKPNKTSIKGEKFQMEDGKDFFCISYKSFITKWLLECKEKASSYPLVREIITQYYNLVLKLTNQYMNNTTKEKVVDLLANKENIASLFKINEAYYDVINRVCNTTLIQNIKEIEKEIEGEKLECICSERRWNEKWNGQFVFIKPEWKNFCIGFEFMNDGFKNFCFGIKYRSESKGSSEETKLSINKRLKEIDPKWSDSNEWWAAFKQFQYRGVL